MNPRVHEVTADQAGIRLDRILADVWPDHSRSYWQQQIAKGRVTVDGRVLRAGTPLNSGQKVRAVLVVEEPGYLWDLGTTPADWPDWVVYHDASIIVINKPRGLVVHPSAGHRDDSVVHQLRPWLAVSEGTLRPGVVHRLDKDTSGLLIVARGARAREALAGAIQRREVIRDYVAVVRGRLKPPVGVIDAPLGRHPRHRLKMAVVQDGRSARTHYRTIAEWPGFTLVQCTLDTGRTHQIRVHMASLGHPVVGDSLYGGRHPRFEKGQLLHAGRLGFVHPDRDEWMEFHAPVPDDWRALVDLGSVLVVDSELYRGSGPQNSGEWLAHLGCDVVSRMP